VRGVSTFAYANLTRGSQELSSSPLTSMHAGHPRNIRLKGGKFPVKGFGIMSVYRPGEGPKAIRAPKRGWKLPGVASRALATRVLERARGAVVANRCAFKFVSMLEYARMRTALHYRETCDTASGSAPEGRATGPGSPKGGDQEQLQKLSEFGPAGRRLLRDDQGRVGDDPLADRALTERIAHFVQSGHDTLPPLPGCPVTPLAGTGEAGFRGFRGRCYGAPTGSPRPPAKTPRHRGHRHVPPRRGGLPCPLVPGVLVLPRPRRSTSGQVTTWR
jgi:hypothetical protein